MNSNFDLNHYETGFLLLKSLIDHGVLGNVDAKLYVVKPETFEDPNCVLHLYAWLSAFGML